MAATNLIGKIFSSGIGEVIDSIGAQVDKFTLSGEEKQAFKLELQSRLIKMEEAVQETYKTELESRTEIIKAEMAQGDSFTKRARPMIVYAGLLFIFFVYILIPSLAFVSGTPPAEIPQINLPSEFWWSWGTVVGVYGVGRSAEKMGVVNKFTDMITGSNNAKQ